MKKNTKNIYILNLTQAKIKLNTQTLNDTNLMSELYPFDLKQNQMKHFQMNFLQLSPIIFQVPLLVAHRVFCLLI